MGQVSNMRLLTTLLLGGMLLGCRGTVDTLGWDAVGGSHGANIMEAIAVHLKREGAKDEFGPLQTRLTAQALTPSLLYGDNTVWTDSTMPDRTLRFVGRRHEQTYAMFPHRRDHHLSQIGDASYVFHLRKLRQDEYRWTTYEKYLIGSVPLESVLRGFAVTFGAGEGRTGEEVMQDVLRTFPRAGEVFSRMLSLDQVVSTPDVEGTTRSKLLLTFHPDRLRDAGYKDLAGYLDQYITPLIMNVSLTTREGVPFFTLDMADNRLSLQWRVRRGEFVPLAGPVVPIPNQLRMVMDIQTKAMMVTVGASSVVADFDVTSAPDEIGWLFRFHQTPHWVVPLGAAGVFKDTLERPFQGEGILLHVGLMKDGPRTIAFRRIRAELKETMLMRFWAKVVEVIGNGFVEGTEKEGYRFFRLGSEATRDDAMSIPSLASQ